MDTLLALHLLQAAFQMVQIDDYNEIVRKSALPFVMFSAMPRKVAYELHKSNLEWLCGRIKGEQSPDVGGVNKECSEYEKVKNYMQS